VLVALQMKQASDLTRVQMGNDAWMNNTSFNQARMGENPQAVIAKTRGKWESLSDAELVADHRAAGSEAGRVAR
jgi:hypothetical protein